LPDGHGKVRGHVVTKPFHSVAVKSPVCKPY